MSLPRHDAVVLAGGAGRRLGGVDKAGVLVAGRTLLDRTLDAARHARRTVVVGPAHLAPPGTVAAQEDPPGSGPAAGLAAGLAALADDDAVVLVLACDTPRAVDLVPRLLLGLAAHPAADGTQAVDAAGRAQPLLAAYRGGALRRVLADHPGGVADTPLRRVLAPLAVVAVPDAGGATQDADTWDDVAELERRLGAEVAR